MERFDLIVIGSGSGLDVANAAAESGMKVAIIEKDRMGGTCLNRGCIPSKLLIHSADIMETVKNAGRFGIDIAGPVSVDFEKVMQRTWGIVDPDAEGIRRAFESIDNPRLFPHECRFVGRKEIAVEGDSGGKTTTITMITADKVLIATGARPGVPRIEGLEGSGYITSDQALRLKKLPQSMTVIGGGYVAAELAHFFGSLGTKVSIIQRRDVMLADEDEEISAAFTKAFAKKHAVYTGYSPQSVSKGGGLFMTRAKNAQGMTAEIESEQLLVATGRVPNSDTLQLEKAGVETDRDGFIKVDEYLETSAKGIFALGDAVGRYQFKHSANHEAQYAFNNITRPQKKIAVDYTAMPHAIFASPQVASAGHTEQELRGKGVRYVKSIYRYADTAMGRAIGDEEGFVKLLVSEKNRMILGCHIVGPEASVLIHEVLVAMKAGLAIDAVARTVHIHPALSEVVSRAAYMPPPTSHHHDHQGHDDHERSESH
ncbi:dihydrolipoyl dehydrogenase [Nitrososphaera sp.]|uniref:dihydrolipoyl dehydrogenase family protein n=1 Tax=Nitrososphaera sp. TaxID=1971748 RepID=UPI00307F3C4E